MRTDYEDAAKISFGASASASGPELHLSSFVIPQVPGSTRRSAPVHGVAGSIPRAKKYMLPLLALHPVLTSGFVVAAVDGDRFNPARNAMIFDASRELEPAMAAPERREYQDRLTALKQPLAEDNLWNATTWQQLQADAVPGLDGSGKSGAAS